MNGPTLVVLAAGLGSRFGGIKQMAPVGPSGEFILDYSVYDAWKAGFQKVVFIVRQEMIEPLKEHFGDALAKRMEVEFVVQNLNELPAGFQCPPERSKPWGTGHAIWCARNAVQGPFAAINADDFYGFESFQALAKAVADDCTDASCAMVAFQLSNTLSENGTVSRGICTVDAQGNLLDITECHEIEAVSGGVRYRGPDGESQLMTGQEPASMNLLAFPNCVFAHIQRMFVEFLQEHGQELKAEFYIPTVVNRLINENGWKVTVRQSGEQWSGMTYAADRPAVLERISKLIEQGKYPRNLNQ